MPSLVLFLWSLVMVLQSFQHCDTYTADASGTFLIAVGGVQNGEILCFRHQGKDRHHPHHRAKSEVGFGTGEGTASNNSLRVWNSREILKRAATTSVSCAYPDVEASVVQWLKQVWTKNLSVSDQLLVEKA